MVILLFVTSAVLLAALAGVLLHNARQKRFYLALARSQRELKEARDETRATLYSIGDGVIATDAEGRVARMNPVAERLTGWPEAEAVGKPLAQVFSLINEETRAATESPVERVLREGVVAGLANHTLLISRDKTERPIADSGAPIRNAEGGISGVVLVFRDQSSERAARSALEENEARYRSLFEQARDAILLLEMPPDGEPVIRDVNAAALKALGYSRGEILDKPVSILNQDSADVRSIMGKSWRIRAADGMGFEVRHKRKDGTFFTVDAAGREVLIGGKRMVFSVERDVTEKKKTVERLEKVNSVLLSLGPDSDANRAALVELFGVLLETDCAMYNRLEGENFRVQSSWGDCLGQPVFKAEGTPCFEVLRAPEAARGLLFNDLSSFVSAKCMADKGFKSYFGHPVRLQGGQGVICALYKRAYEPSEEDRKLLGIIASAIGMEEARSAGETSLRESEERYRAVANYSNNAICILDVRGRFLWVNDRLLSMGGYSREDYLAAESYAKFVAPESLEFLAANFRKFAAGLPYERHYNFFFVRADGQHRVCENYVTDYRDKDGKVNLVISMLDITERVQAETDRERLTKAIEQAGDTVLISDPQGVIQYVNPAFEAVSGYSRAEIVGKKISILKSGRQDEAFYRDLWTTISAGHTWKNRIVNRRKDGAMYTIDANISPVFGPGGRITNYVSVRRDVTGQLQLERKLRQSQKMETVGLLAGGVAHDFNNILSAIICYAGFIIKDLDPGDPKLADIKEILTAAERAASLTGQLLAFSRRQMLAPQVVDINRLAGGMTRMLERIIGENIKLAVKLHPAPCLANVDSGQIEQVIMNLVLNARDSMPGGGAITLSTEIINPPEEFFDIRPDLPIGPLVRLKVSDTGSGMDEEVRNRLFEPFFTTKEQGKGTGLGLSTVFGIVKQSHGDIEVESESGKGSSFSVYLPFEEKPLREKGGDKDENRGEKAPAKGHETILLVEDEVSLRRLGERVLRSGGYTVLAASDGQAALKLMEERGAPVDLLITDVVMPVMSGKELALDLTRRNLASRVLYMSGYTDDAIVKHGVLEPGIAFIYKPFTVDSVLLKLREVLDGPAGQAKA